MEIVYEGCSDPPKLESERRKHVKQNYEKPIIEPLLDGEEKYLAEINGMDIIVKIPLHAQRIFSMGNFGTFIGQRMNFANWKCFSSEPENCEGTSKESGSLIKSSSFDSKQNAKEWIVLYKDGIELHHSCAGIRIASMLDPIITDNSISAVQRELSNCKKQLLIAAIDFKILEEKVKLNDIEMAKVNVLSLNHWSLHKNRAMDLD
uniref:Uncharacterized protein n=1 Tax=Meloidogyne hapla TaxID=6305 RepID=A0A1I8C348_MELHA